MMLAGLLIAVAGLGGCADEPIGQPCTFSWPLTGEGEDAHPDCTILPACQPLQAAVEMPAAGTPPANDACPVDCIQLPSLQCTNLICVATQADEGGEYPDGVSHKAENVMNGECRADVTQTDCPSAPYGCMGYCTKECLSDASCPKGYRCSAMAPFGANMRCDNEELWGDGGLTAGSPDPTKQCTDGCIPTGQPVNGVICPSSRITDGEAYDYAKCESKDYQQCCACMCNQYCPLLTKKFCRKIAWDHDMFPGAVTTNNDCQQTDD